jgi:Uma2 family endonuclease
VSTVTIPLLTVENYKILPETGPRYQLIEGDLYMAPAPNRYHQDISRNLEYVLLDYLEEHPIGKLYDAPFDVYLDQYNVFQPDILVVLNEHLSILTDAGAEGAPDFVVEILSPKTARLDRDNKRRVYATSGVRELWIIAPETRQIAIYLLGQDAAEPSATYGEQDNFESALFPGLRFQAAAIFAQ